MPPSFTPLSETKFSENAPFQKIQSDNLEYKINIKRAITGGKFLRDIFLNNAIENIPYQTLFVYLRHVQKQQYYCVSNSK